MLCSDLFLQREQCELLLLERGDGPRHQLDSGSGLLGNLRLLRSQFDLLLFQRRDEAAGLIQLLLQRCHLLTSGARHLLLLCAQRSLLALESRNGAVGLIQLLFQCGDLLTGGDSTLLRLFVEKSFLHTHTVKCINSQEVNQHATERLREFEKRKKEEENKEKENKNIHDVPHKHKPLLPTLRGFRRRPGQPQPSEYPGRGAHLLVCGGQ
jgi:hypothetical protein